MPQSPNDVPRRVVCPFIKADLPPGAAQETVAAAFRLALETLGREGTPGPFDLKSHLQAASDKLMQELTGYQMTPTQHQQATADALIRMHAALFVILAGLRRDAPDVDAARAAKAKGNGKRRPG